MEIMVKCPFWGEPCLKEECSAFEYKNVCLWNDKDRYDYRHFKQEQIQNVGYIDKIVYEWWALKIPHCRILDKELPMKIEKVWKEPHVKEP